MGVQLRVALPARAVHEPRHHPTLVATRRRTPLRLLPGHRRPLLQEPQRLGDRLPVGGGHHLRHRLRTQRPQQRHALRRRERQIERPHRPSPTRHQRLARHRVQPVHQVAQLVGLHHPRQAQPLRPAAGPHPRRLPHPGVVLVDTQRHRRNQILPIRQPRHRQHPPPPPTPSPSQPHHPRHPHPPTATPTSTTDPDIPNNQTGTDTCHPPGGTPSAALTTTPRPGPNASCPGVRREGGCGDRRAALGRRTTVSPVTGPST